jgi:hypothetical protein
MTHKAWQSKMRYRRRMKVSRKEQVEGRAGKKYGYIYIMGMGGELFKIGWTFNVQKRLKEFQTANPLLALVHAEHVTDPRLRESTLHKRYANKRAAGEWFRLTEDDIAAIKAYLASLTPPRIPDELAYLNQARRIVTSEL